MVLLSSWVLSAVSIVLDVDLQIGGCEWGGYVNQAAGQQDNPTYEVSLHFSDGSDCAVLSLQRRTGDVELFDRHHARQSLSTHLASSQWYVD
jgi:hypothetical protein